jgi:Zn-dependent M28 family amino/carboxypeptidase
MTFNEQIWGYLDHTYKAPSLSLLDNEKDPASSFAHIWIEAPEGFSVSTFEPQQGIPVTLNMNEAQNEIIQSQNVVGVVEGTDPTLKKEYIIYSAHYDHVGIGSADATGDTIYNGARDNAVGTVTVLSMAENLAKYPTKRSALFILFTAEEKGLLGSEYYVENPVLPLEQMVYCFNSDNGGYNDTSLATIIGLERTTAAQHIKDAASAFGLRAIEDPSPEQGLFDRSDNVHFARKGIPAPTFSMGFSAFDEEINKYYHQPGDHADSIDYGYLLKFFRAYVLSGRKIANDQKTPFWIKGDTYEANGLQLYADR